jgi:hypothetical protein
MCGHQSEESSLISDLGLDEELAEEGQAGEESGSALDAGTSFQQAKAKNIKIKVTEKTSPPKPGKSDDELMLKEIESWKFTFSPADQCIYAGTPALHPFRLKLTREDLKDLLEAVYEKTGMELTSRKLQLSGKDALDLIEVIDSLIEEKKARIKIKFTSEELKEITDIINRKLQV